MKKGKGEGDGSKNTLKVEKKALQGLVQKPRSAPATPGAAQPALMVSATSSLFGGSF